MSYEIPQQLEYKERVVFGLTFSQLAWAMLFGLPAVSVFFKSHINLYVKSAVVIVLCVVAVCFMFFNASRFLLDFWAWFRFRKAVNGSPKLEKFVGVKDVKDNLILTNNNKVAVLRVEPFNFAIKGEQEKESILGAFQKFLNSIDFPIQVLMTTDALEVDSYLESLKERVEEVTKNTKNLLYPELFDKYSQHLKKTVAKKGIMDRNFYLVIPEANDISIQVEICKKKLEDLNLKVERLDDEKLKLLLTKCFGGSGEGNKSLSFQPKSIENFLDCLKVNDVFNRVVVANGYPRSVEAGFLDKIVSASGDFDLSLFIVPYPIETMMVLLNKELQKQKADLYAAELKGSINPSLEIQYADTRRVLDELQKGRDKLFNISLYINCKAETKEELNLLGRKVEAELNSLLIIPKLPRFRMAQAFKSCTPLGLDVLKTSRNITTYSLSAFFPFTSPFFQVDNTGIWLGLNKNNIPVIRDVFKLSNPNGLILAQSGGGKSFFSKLLIARYLLNGVRVMVIDPQGEYKGLAKQFNGQRIDLSRTSKTMINPLDLMGHDYTEKRLSLMDLMQVMLGELTEPQKTFIDKALTRAYEEKGISDDPNTWNNQPPILADVLKVLESMEKRAIVLEKSTLRSLINRLSMYVDGVFSFMNRHTNINFDNQFVCFDIGEMPKQVKPVTMFLVLDYVYMKMRQNLERKLLVIDEAWSLLSRTEDASYIFEIVKTCRKFNLGLLLINQEVEGMLSSEAGKSVLANSAYTFLMRQKPAVIEQIQETFHLSPAERNYLLSASVGEGILLMEDEHTELKVIASEEEYNIITTNPDELIKKQEQTKTANKVEQKKVIIKVDPEKGFYRKKDLSQEETDFLIRKGYAISSHCSIGCIRQEKFLLKLDGREGKDHFFMVRAVEEYLRQSTDKVEVFETAKPDIVFETPKSKKIAIEVETGTTLEKRKDLLQKKVEELNKEYGKNWFFLVTDNHYAYHYRKFGKTFTRKSVAKKLRNYFKSKNLGRKKSLKNAEKIVVEKRAEKSQNSEVLRRENEKQGSTFSALNMP
jgi:type IV secretory pathway VirB4 component